MWCGEIRAERWVKVKLAANLSLTIIISDHLWLLIIIVMIEDMELNIVFVVLTRTIRERVASLVDRAFRPATRRVLFLLLQALQSLRG